MAKIIPSTSSILAMASAATVTERTLLCSDGMRLAARHYRSPNYVEEASAAAEGNIGRKRILCLHGWLDNAASFHLLAPALAATRWGMGSDDGVSSAVAAAGGTVTDVVALDFPGHGLSSHKSPDGPTQLLAEYAFYVAEAADQLGWWGPNAGKGKDDDENTDAGNKFSLVGHSMGAGVSVVFAAAFPERVESIVLIDGFAPLPRNARDCTKHIRKACETRMASNRNLYTTNPSVVEGDDDGGRSKVVRNAVNRIYPSLDKAIQTRMATARASPGKQYLSEEAARAMVERATKQAGPNGEVTFRHDPRLYWPSLQYLTWEQIEGLLEDVSMCPTCVLLAEDGWPFDERLQQKGLGLLKPDVKHILPGSHHLHADPETAGEVIERVRSFHHAS